MKQIKFSFYVFAITLFLCQALISQPKWFKEVVINSSNIEVHADAPALTLLDYGEAVISKNLSAKIKVRIAYKILTQKGEHYANFTFAGNPTTKLDGLKGWIYKTNGTYKSLDDDNIVETSSIEDAMYYDKSKTIHASLPGVKPGVIVGYEFEIEENEWTSLYQSFFFQDKLPVNHVKYSITLPEGWKLIRSEWKMDEISFTQTGQKFIWEGRNLPFRPREPLSPSSSYLSKRLSVTAYDPNRVGSNQFENWEQVGNWCYNLYKEQSEPNAEIKKTMAEITTGMTSIEDKINAIAQFIQKEIRYVAIEVGKGRWQPRKASQTFDNRFGDCKDKTTLMCAMLKTLDINSYPVLINASFSIDDEVPTPFQFNHVILGIPVNGLELSDNLMDGVIDGYLYFDPTSESTPFGELPPRLLGRRILIGAHEDSLFFRLKYPEPKARRRVLHLDGQLAEDGTFSAKINIANFDVLANSEKGQHRYLSLDEQKEQWEEQLNKTIPVFDISNFERYNHSDSVGIKFDISGKGLIQTSGGLSLFKPDIFTKSEPNPLTALDRESPIWLGASIQREIDVNWNIPEAMEAEKQEDSVKHECHDCSIGLNLSIKNNQLEFNSKKIIKGRLIDKEEYSEVSQFTKVLSHVKGYTVLFAKKQ